MVGQPTEDYPRIYTAGAMRWQSHGDSWWRRSVEESLADITFYHPEDAYFDHGGDYVQGAVSEDVQAINAADGVVAYYSETPQIGTTVETLHALHTDTPTLVLFDADLISPPTNERIDYPEPLESALYRGTADDHWFLINYINGDDEHSGQRLMPSWISAWEGKPRGSVFGVETTADIRQAVADWASDEFDVELE
ncbi:hypothetical protein [Natronorubrum sp. FCH18a]|uniref:hypothetical protein n=1 Tax=Natronorubrum sp. FCH18a TaxID=3447018 RepID=UPI003F50F546